MPLYETVIQEKPPIILDIGTVYTKIGFAAETSPRFIIPTEVCLSTEGKLKNIFHYEKTIELYDQLVDFFQIIFFKHTLVSPKERKIVIVESVFNTTEIRETVAKVLFCHYEVSSILFLATHLVSLATLVIDTAIVIDMGYRESTVLPVYCGIQILNAFQAQPYGGKLIHQEIRKQLCEIDGINEEYLTENILEDIKIRTCFVTTFERAQKYKLNQPPTPPPDIEYPINGKEIIKIPGKLRETVFEVIFPDDTEYNSLAHQILDAILNCPLDMRKTLAENIFFIGGTSMIMGLMARIKSELYNLLKSPLYKEKLYLDTIKFHNGPAKRNFTSWLGGSIYGGTDLVLTNSLTKEQYNKCPRVPDWINLDDNRLPNYIKKS